ncbi:LytR/AlgR family response regulator transcription factor [Croceiramulus getboli]|nr:LytTR family DNA-binding domain-containing protein [Flavobacteriaceae bacterium YJPT1-3]
MDSTSFRFKPANRYLLHILLVGLGIGTANYLLQNDLNWMQWCIQSVVTSFMIGYTLVVLGLNRAWLQERLPNLKIRIVMLFFLFTVAGLLATEVEHLMRALIFQNQYWNPFSSGTLYLFNAIIACILGFSFFQTVYSEDSSVAAGPIQAKPKIDPNDIGHEKHPVILTQIPVKQGEDILLISVQEVLYFEAYDNYAFVYQQSGSKKLCDYSLSFLETRLDASFSRIHRKYIVNQQRIQTIKPHLNGRFILEFGSGHPTITSSKTYAQTVRDWIKLK